MQPPTLLIGNFHYYKVGFISKLKNGNVINQYQFNLLFKYIIIWE